MNRYVSLTCSFVVTVGIAFTACMLSPRNGQVFPGGTGSAIPFGGHVRVPGLAITIQAFNFSRSRYETVAVANSATSEADCDVASQCWYAFNTSKVLPSRYWSNVSGGLVQAMVRATPIDPPPGQQFIVTFDTGSAVDQCLEDTYNQFGGTQAAVSCGRGLEATIFTCRNPPCA